MKTEIFQFIDPIDYLNFELERRKIKNPKYSLRAWSRQLEFENPAFLSQILLRKRSLKLEVAKKISLEMKLPSKEGKYFKNMVLLANAKTLEEQSVIHEALMNLRESKPIDELSINLDIFRFVSEWYYVAILEVFNLKHFDGRATTIVEELEFSLPRTTIEHALERLLRLDLIRADKKGFLKRTADSCYLVDQNIPHEAIRGFHSKMIQKSLASIEEQDSNERSLRASTLCLREEDYKIAIELIRDVHEKITMLSRNGDGEKIYQFNTQLFNLLPLPKGSNI